MTWVLRSAGASSHKTSQNASTSSQTMEQMCIRDRFKTGGWRGGFGILFDDFVAAFCVLLLFALWRF